MSLSRVGPLSVLAACLLPVIGAFAIDSVTPGAILLVVEVLAVGWLARDLRSSRLRFLLGGIAALSITITTWLYGGQDVDASLGAGCRILYIVVPAALLTPRVQPSELGDHLAQRLHLPARVAVAMVVALQRIEELANQWQQVQRARRARGRGLDGSAARRVRTSAGGAFGLLVISMRSTGATAMAMGARGFSAAHRRTWAEDAPWRAGDSLLLAIGLGLAALPWILR